MTLTPFYFDRAPSGKTLDHINENGGISMYIAWKKKMKQLSQVILNLLTVLQDENKNTHYSFGQALVSANLMQREKFIDGLRKSFEYLANDNEFTSNYDHRNADAVSFIKLVSSPNYNPELSYDEKVKDAELNNFKVPNIKLKEAFDAVLDLIASDYTSDNIAEVLIAEYTRSHRTHQQTIARNIHGAFGFMHLNLKDESATSVGWALRAGRSNIGFIYI